MSNKKNIIYIAIVLSIFLLLGIFLLSKREKTIQDINQMDDNIGQENNESTPEEVLEEMDDKYTIVLSENSDLSITSPIEETFIVGQARMWEGTLTGIEHGVFKTNCKWDFYMNDELYKTMDKPSSASKDDPTTCGFTSTFINIAGELKVELTVDVLNSDNTVLDTYSTSNIFTVL